MANRLATVTPGQLYSMAHGPNASAAAHRIYEAGGENYKGGMPHGYEYREARQQHGFPPGDPHLPVPSYYAPFRTVPASNEMVGIDNPEQFEGRFPDHTFPVRTHGATVVPGAYMVKDKAAPLLYERQMWQTDSAWNAFASKDGADMHPTTLARRDYEDNYADPSVPSKLDKMWHDAPAGMQTGNHNDNLGHVDEYANIQQEENGLSFVSMTGAGVASRPSRRHMRTDNTVTLLEPARTNIVDGQNPGGGGVGMLQTGAPGVFVQPEDPGRGLEVVRQNAKNFKAHRPEFAQEPATWEKRMDGMTNAQEQTVVGSGDTDPRRGQLSAVDAGLKATSKNVLLDTEILHALGK